jgi:membrane-bound lytic murein transglycosylase D
MNISQRTITCLTAACLTGLLVAPIGPAAFVAYRSAAAPPPSSPAIRSLDRIRIDAGPAPIPAAMPSRTVPPPPAKREADRDPDLIRRAKVIFRQEGVPEQLAWVAMVESSLNPRARSRAGAVGLYQLMPETAREVGLRVRGRLDDRYNAEYNTRGAARYLSRLGERFGSWTLALAAYNAGPTRVERLLRRHRARTFREIARFLPRETRRYVPKVYAAISRYETTTGETGGARTLALAPADRDASAL